MDSATIRIVDRTKTASCRETLSMCGTYTVSVEPSFTGTGYVVLSRRYDLPKVWPLCPENDEWAPPIRGETADVVGYAVLTNGQGTLKLDDVKLVKWLTKTVPFGNEAEVPFSVYVPSPVQGRFNMAGHGALRILVTEEYGSVDTGDGYEPILFGPGNGPRRFTSTVDFADDVTAEGDIVAEQGVKQRVGDLYPDGGGVTKAQAEYTPQIEDIGRLDGCVLAFMVIKEGANGASRRNEIMISEDGLQFRRLCRFDAAHEGQRYCYHAVYGNGKWYIPWTSTLTDGWYETTDFRTFTEKLVKFDGMDEFYGNRKRVFFTVAVDGSGILHGFFCRREYTGVAQSNELVKMFHAQLDAETGECVATPTAFEPLADMSEWPESVIDPFFYKDGDRWLMCVQDHSFTDETNTAKRLAPQVYESESLLTGYALVKDFDVAQELEGQSIVKTHGKYMMYTTCPSRGVEVFVSDDGDNWSESSAVYHDRIMDRGFYDTRQRSFYAIAIPSDKMGMVKNLAGSLGGAGPFAVSSLNCHMPPYESMVQLHPGTGIKLALTPGCVYCLNEAGDAVISDIDASMLKPGDRCWFLVDKSGVLASESNRRTRIIIPQSLYNTFHYIADPSGDRSSADPTYTDRVYLRWGRVSPYDQQATQEDRDLVIGTQSETDRMLVPMYRTKSPGWNDVLYIDLPYVSHAQMWNTFAPSSGDPKPDANNFVHTRKWAFRTAEVTMANHFPVAVGGVLEVIRTEASATIQRYTTISGTSNKVFTRSLSGSTWSEWKEIGAASARIIVVSSLPSASSAEEGAIYLLPKSGGTGTDVYEEWVIAHPSGGSKSWELVGTTAIDLSGYKVKSVKRNGITLTPDTDGAVDVSVPTKLNDVCPDTENWLGVPGTTAGGKSLKVLAKTVNGVIEGGMTVTGSSNNDNNTTKYRYGGVTVTRNGVATDYLFDCSQSGIARLSDLDSKLGNSGAQTLDGSLVAHSVAIVQGGGTRTLKALCATTDCGMTALGRCACAQSKSVAIGACAKAKGSTSTAIGYGAIACGGATVIGATAVGRIGYHGGLHLIAPGGCEDLQVKVHLCHDRLELVMGLKTLCVTRDVLMCALNGGGGGGGSTLCGETACDYIRLGRNSAACGCATTAIGNNASAEYGGTAVGANSVANNNGTAVGLNAYARTGGTAVGELAKICSCGGTALGERAWVKNGGMALGEGAKSAGGVAVGKQACVANGGIAIGYKGKGLGGGIGIGYCALARKCGVAVGYKATALAKGVAVGKHAMACFGGTAIGMCASAGQHQLVIQSAVTCTYDCSTCTTTRYPPANMIKLENAEGGGCAYITFRIGNHCRRISSAAFFQALGVL